MIRLVALFLLVTSWAVAVDWHVTVPFDRGMKKGKPLPQGRVLCWIPPEVEQIRGLFVLGPVGIEEDLVYSQAVRKVCAENGIAIVYFKPHVSGLFKFWEEGDTSKERFLNALGDLAEVSGISELKRVPWITAGHSTAGIFARNVAYAFPERVAGIFHIKSGNFHQANILPPNASIAGIPLIAINGEFESFGPATGMDDEWDRQTQWVYVRKDIHKFKEKDENHLMSLVVHPGADHFFGTREMSEMVAKIIERIAEHRLPKNLPDGDEPVKLKPMSLSEGWLASSDPHAADSGVASYADYKGDKKTAYWYLDEEHYKASAEFMKNFSKYVFVEKPEGKWLDEGNGWVFTATAQYAEAFPEKYGEKVNTLKLPNPGVPPVIRVKPHKPLKELAPGKWQVLRLERKKRGKLQAILLSAWFPGNEVLRSTIRWKGFDPKIDKGWKKQVITFPELGDGTLNELPELAATSDSGLPVYYEVDYGPVQMENDYLVSSDVNSRLKFPLECSVTAYQVGKRIGDEPVAPADPVTRVFTINGE